MTGSQDQSNQIEKEKSGSIEPLFRWFCLLVAYACDKKLTIRFSLVDLATTGVGEDVGNTLTTRVANIITTAVIRAVSLSNRKTVCSRGTCRNRHRSSVVANRRTESASHWIERDVGDCLGV